MTTMAITPDYMGDMKDTVDKFHGNQIVYFSWDHHQMFCSPIAFPLPPTMPFGALLSDVLPGGYAMHPDFAQIDWERVSWRLNGKPWTPEPEKSLTDNGIDHKSVLRFATPGLNGIKGCGT